MLNPLLALLVVLPVPVFAATSITIFNENLALVRESMPLTLLKGENEIVHAPVTPGIDPASILLLPENSATFKILEQGFEHNMPTEASLLRRYEGKPLQFLIKEQEKPDRVVTGIVLAANGDQSLVEIDGAVRIGLPGQPLFPPFSEGTRLHPAIVWRLTADKNHTTNATLAYLTAGLEWSAEYTLVSRGDGATADFSAWVAITNDSTRDFEQSTINLMAGDVSVSASRQQLRESARSMAMAPMAAMDSEGPGVEERSFADMHLYTINRPVTLRSGESKQVEFAAAPGIATKKVYIYDPQQAFIPRYYGPDRLERLTNEEFGSQAGTTVDILLEIENTKKNGLGIALPAGTFRFYQMDGSSLEFTGERRIGHTAPGEKLRLTMGTAFDLAGKRVRRDLKVDTANNTTTEQIEISLRNRKDTAVTIQVIERLARGTNWEIRDPVGDFERLDSNRIQFTVPVPAAQEATVAYTVRYTW